MPTIGDVYVMLLHEYTEDGDNYPDEPGGYMDACGREFKLGLNVAAYRQKIKFTKTEYFVELLNRDSAVAYITIPEGVSVVKNPESNIWYANRIYITNIIDLCQLECWNNEEFRLTAVRKNGMSLRHIPEQFKTSELCLLAVQQDGRSLEFVPSSLQTEDICLNAVRENADSVEFICPELLTEEICLEAVKQDGYALCYIPGELRTYEICLEAVRRIKYMLHYAPDHLKTPEFLRLIEDDI
jgi:hypothetical protein